ncbi:hypothetical protein ARMGADRAFT_1031145 [Armillaria gallica]|uniref:Uncharacterized protein n=1 Tax=Armillaria gallica TaxID=47427 RepID=A0A2H3DEP0_ARMGA|nr:hypothetical protein ARMGADRAFT_1031145 [Armillaria gallica]
MDEDQNKPDKLKGSEDAPKTQSGWTQQARDLHAVLQTCVCGEEIDSNQIDKGIIACKQEGCETGLDGELVMGFYIVPNMFLKPLEPAKKESSMLSQMDVW